ncbi:MAG: hypothetical protein M3017_05130 [Actinomycetota bacterium]|nr:hypothetical protein [Actinomycetota bacterium]
MPPADRPSPPQGSSDFITVDDGGFFEYQPSAAAVERRSEYPAETECIVDRQGNNYTLGPGADGRLGLRRSLGLADFRWLRRAWRRVQAEHPDQYPLFRRLPEADDLFLRMLFEVLPSNAGGGAGWRLLLEAQETSYGSLLEVGRALARAQNPAAAVVADPYGHRYHPQPRQRRRLGIRTGTYLVFVES